MENRKKLWHLKQKKMAKDFEAWILNPKNPDKGFQERYPFFHELIHCALENRTASSINLIGLTKFQVEFMLKDLFYTLAADVGKEELVYEIIVGKGRFSYNGPQIPGKVKEICQKDFDIPVKFLTENDGTYQVRISPEAGKWMRMMRDIKKNISDLETSLDGKKNPRMFNGFSREGFNPIVLQHWYDQISDEEILLQVWACIIDLTSKKFLLAVEKQLSKTQDSQLLKQLKELHQQKPHSLSEITLKRLGSKPSRCIVYTFTSAKTIIDFKLLCSERNLKECLSPSEKNVEELLNTNQSLIMRFDEQSGADNILEKPIYKKLQNIKSIIEKNKTHSESIFLIIHIVDEIENGSNFLPYDSNWEQYMIDSL